jgi:hypothetical protein
MGQKTPTEMPDATGEMKAYATNDERARPNWRLHRSNCTATTAKLKACID